MYRRVLPLLLTAVLLLSGCTAGQKNMPQKTDEKEMTGQPSDMSGEGSMYMDTTENVIYLAGGCFWGMEQLMQSIPGVIDARAATPTAPARRTPIIEPSAKGTPASGRPCGWSMTPGR